MNKIMNIKEHAVSPVVGVLLMLVVTIIVAAIVSAFAGGLSGGADKAPQASIVATKIVVDEAYHTNPTSWSMSIPAGKSPNAYIMFENKGGDGIPITDLTFRFAANKYPADRVQIDNTITPNSLIDRSNIKSDWFKNWERYIEVYPDRTSSSISPGTMFVVHFDFAKWIQSSTYPNYKSVDFRPDGATNSMSTTEGDYLLYDAIDRRTNKIISSGKILIPEFTVHRS